MSDPVETFRKMTEDTPYVYAARACSTCRHRPRIFHSVARCEATGEYVDFERNYAHKACGSQGKLWEPIPPRIGLVGWIKRLLVGDRP